MAPTTFWKDAPRPPLVDPVNEGRQWAERVSTEYDSSSDNGLVAAAARASVSVEIGQVDEYDGPAAYLLPRTTGGFRLVVADPSVRRIDRPAVHRVPDQAAMNFLVAHELGHLFFYDREFVPARRTRHPSDTEEAFCDEFALTLLGLAD